jgi:hypothetical protein
LVFFFFLVHFHRSGITVAVIGMGLRIVWQHNLTLRTRITRGGSGRHYGSKGTGKEFGASNAVMISDDFTESLEILVLRIASP